MSTEMEVKLVSSQPCKRTARQASPRISNTENTSTSSKRKQATAAGRLPLKRSSAFRGVTRHRWTGRFEAHLWDKSSWNDKQHKKGRQVYLGAYDDEASAAKAYDLAALKYWGPETFINFKLEDYEQQLVEMESSSREEYLATLRRKSSGFSRGVSKYRGVARHHHNGRWEARIGRVDGNKYLYLGTFGTQEEAARAYDLAAIEFRGAAAVTNFELTSYSQDLPNTRDPPKESFSKLRHTQDGGSTNDLLSLGRRVASTHSPTTATTRAHAVTGANFGDVTSTTFVKFEEKRLRNPDPLAFASPSPSPSPSPPPCEDDGFTAEELSEMETSGSSDVTSVTEPKQEEQEVDEFYDWSQCASFDQLPSMDDSPEMECESQHHHLQRLEQDSSFANYASDAATAATPASFWNHHGFMSGFPSHGLHDGMEQDSFLSIVLSGELPSAA